jgi:uncharacterized membrane protein YjgN (DUF898 family)
MEEQITQNNEYRKSLTFYGDHAKAVGLVIINQILTVVTLGMYYPWAKASQLKYVYAESEYLDSRFEFHGTGKEMFLGFIKALAVIIILYAAFFAVSYYGVALGIGFVIGASLLFYAIIIALIPIAVHGSNKYRLSRSSWRGIHFGYRGELKEFAQLFFKEVILTIVTLGIYSAWMHVSVRKYITQHTRFGNVEFDYTANGVDLFIIRLKGIILIILTLGIYSFWYFKELIAFEVENTKIVQDERVINLQSTLSGGDVFLMFFTNYLIIIFTLGIGTGIAINRALRITYSNIEFDGDIDTNNLVQTEDEYKDATGDDLSSMLDISI